MPSPATIVDPTVLRGWAATGRDALEEAREEIDELNVYPVPDGDTGTNLHLTVEAAALTLTELPEAASPAETLATLARGALLGARGNSGVILSQVLRGLADAATHDAAELGPASWAAALTRGAEAAYAAVADPVEGTMLTVLREAAAAATTRAGDGGDLADVVRAAATEATAALARTPDQLEVLRLAGVVDAGGRGVCVLLDALVAVVTGEARPPAIARAGRTEAHAPVGPVAGRAAGATRRAAGRPRLRGHVPARRAGGVHPRAALRRSPTSATRWSSSAASPPGTSTST